jgi:hypothetical protein
MLLPQVPFYSKQYFVRQHTVRPRVSLCSVTLSQRERGALPY